MTAALGIRAVEREHDAGPHAALARLSTLTGPYAVEAEDAVSLRPADDGRRYAYVLVAPRERGAKPYPGGDRDGLKRAFPDGDADPRGGARPAVARRRRASARAARCGSATTASCWRPTSTARST